VNNFIPQPWFPPQYSLQAPTYFSGWNCSPYSPTYIPSAYGSYYLNDGYTFRQNQSSIGTRASLNTESSFTGLPFSDYYPPGIQPLSTIIKRSSWTLMDDLQGKVWSYKDDANGRGWGVYFSANNTPWLYSSGTLITDEGTSTVKTITIEDDGKTFTFHSGEELFRIALPIYDKVYDYSTGEDYPRLASWYYNSDDFRKDSDDGGRSNIFGFVPVEAGLEEDEQGNLTYIEGYLFKTIKPTGRSFIPKELVFSYYGPSENSNEMKTTFRVTIVVK